MILSSIVAASENNAIGKDNELPWHLPKDLQFFKRTTLGKPVLMGRKTYESMGKPLPGRLNIVVTRQKDLQVAAEVLVVDNVDEGIRIMEREGPDEGFIIGGGTIFEQTMDLIDRIYFTRVHTEIEGAAAFFPDIDHSHWKMVWEEKHVADEKHKYDFTFQKYERIAL